MSTKNIQIGGSMMSFRQLAAAEPMIKAAAATRLIWAHGWGLSGASLSETANHATHLGDAILVDFPGFGQSPPPPSPWSSADYADALAPWLRTMTTQAEMPRRLIWIGHSFGCRIGIQLAARHPDLIAGLMLVAAAGLPQKPNLITAMRYKRRAFAYKLAKSLTVEGPRRERLRRYFGSPDYADAGPMRAVLVKVVGEDLSEAAAQIRCPVVLLYGTNDTETPVAIGTRFAALIPQSRLIVLDDFDHHNILTRGRHQLLHVLDDFVSNLP